MRNYLAALITLVFCSSSFGYTPKFWFIMDKAPKAHGTGVYKISQTVEIIEKDGSQRMQEDWYIYGDNKMFVTVKGINNQFSYQALYTATNKSYLDGSSVKTEALPDYWLEPFFFFLAPTNIKKYMMQKVMIPRAALSLTKENPSTDENFIKLGRFGGQLAIVIGDKARLDSPSKKPSLWLEKNTYKTLYVSLGNGVSVKTSDYRVPSVDLHLPTMRKVEWDGNVANIKITGVTLLGGFLENEVFFSKDRLNVPKKPIRSSKVNQFYNRFR